MDGLEWKTLLKWMIWGYPYFRKHPYPTSALVPHRKIPPAGKGGLENGAVGLILAKLQLFHQPIDFLQIKGDFPFPFPKKLHFEGQKSGSCFRSARIFADRFMST